MKKRTLKKLHNFIVYEAEVDGMDYIGITTSSGDWCIAYRADCAMYGSLRLLLDNDDALLSFCTLMFITSYTLHGADVYAAIRDAVVKELSDVRVPGVTEEQDAEAMREAVEMEELKEKIAESDGGAD